MANNSIYDKTLFFRNIYDDYNLDLSPSIVGWEMCNKNKPEIFSNKAAYVLHFITNGKGTVIYKNGDLIKLKTGDCFLLEPNSHATYQQDQKEPWSYFWIEINGEQIKKILKKIGLTKNNHFISIKNIEQIIQCFEDIFNDNYYSINQNAETLRVVSIIYRILNIISNEHNIETNDISSSKKEQQIKKIIEYINNNYTTTDISIKKIADAFFFNQAYLTRIFKESTGMSPIKYIIMLRMRRAVELLEKRTFSISQIAYALGYKNQFYFSKEFKRFFGVQPSKYIAKE